MKKTFRIIAYTLVAFMLLVLPNASQAEDPNLPTMIFSEINWAGSPLSNADEWIELANLSNEEINLNGWSITGAASSGEVLLIEQDLFIQPYSTIIIANYATEHEKSSLNTNVSLSTSSLSLSNSGLGLILQNDSGTQIDFAGDGGAPFAGRVGDDGGGDTGGFATMVRLDSLVDGRIAEAWSTSEESIGFKEGLSIFGTPGTSDLIIEQNISDEVQTDVNVDVDVEEDQPDEIDPESDEVELVPEEDDVEPSLIDENADENKNFEEESNQNTTQSVPLAIHYPKDTIIINELVSDPVEGGDEWVEIFNPYNNVIPLSGWRLEDASGKSTLLPDQYLGFEGFVVIKNPAGKLNNSGDTLFLISPSGDIINEMSYGTDTVPSVADPNSLARDDEGKFRITEIPTPGEKNIIFITEEIKSEAKQIIEEENKTEKETQTQIIQTTEDRSREEETEEELGPTTIVISEIYPNTNSVDMEEEFIEITNTGNESIDLKNWKLQDASDKFFKIESSTIIESGEFLALKRETTKLTLNNTSDVVRLIAPSGAIIDTIEYEETQKGFSIAKDGNTWSFTSEITPNEPNRFSTPESINEKQDTKTGVSNASIPSAGSYTSLQSINEARNASDDAKVKIVGTVSVEPGKLGRQIFYLQDEKSGIQIYKYDGKFPNFSIGDIVLLTGTKSTIRGEPRIKISSTDLMASSETESPPEEIETSISELDDNIVGLLVSVSGFVTERSGDKVIIEDNESELTIRIASETNIDPKIFERGKKILISGILSSSNGEYRLYPRGSNDISFEESLPATIASSENQETGKEALEKNHQKTALIIIIGTLMLLAGLLIKYFLPAIKKKYVQITPLRLGT